ncbi:MAG: D-alanyl-D-alanine carboxypeptidase family protein [Ezakiella sp.]|nr:D-alanyl-D-alanine carboxypeptidase family protein [Ezakiella sp.]
MKKLILIIAFLLTINIPIAANNSEDTNSDLRFASYDFLTDTIIEYQGIDDEIAIASVTKLMSALLVFEKINEGSLNLNDSYKYTQEELNLYLYGSDVDIKLGTEVRVSELLDLLLVRSANSSALALAKLVSGSEEAFVKKMNDKAKSLDMNNTHFINSHGLPIIATDEQNISTIRDLIKLCKFIFNNYPNIIDYTKKSEVDLNRLGIRIVTTNPILGRGTIDGLKTGTTNRAGKCLIATATEPSEGLDMNRRVFSFVFGAKSDNERRDKSLELINSSLDNYVYKRVIDGNLLYEMALNPIDYDEESLNIIPKTTLDKLLDVRKVYKLKLVYDEFIAHDIEAGERLGELILLEDGGEVDKVELIAQKSIKRSGWFRRLWKKIKSAF